MTETAASTEKPSTPALKALIGQKVGMTQIYDHHGTLVPVTVVQAGPCSILQILSKDRHGYDGLQVGFGDVKETALTKPEAGHFKKVGITPNRFVREIRTDKASAFQIGQSLKVDVFAPGEYVDVRGVSKGKGFAGAMKRHNFGGGPSTHGQSDRQRAPGSSGSNTYPGRVFKGKRFPGHLGHANITVQHLEVIEVIPEKDLLLIKGAIPGPQQSIVEIRQTLKRVKFHAARQQQAAQKKDKAAKKDAGKAPAKAAPAKSGK